MYLVPEEISAEVAEGAVLHEEAHGVVRVVHAHAQHADHIGVLGHPHGGALLLKRLGPLLRAVVQLLDRAHRGRLVVEHHTLNEREWRKSSV